MTVTIINNGASGYGHSAGWTAYGGKGYPTSAPDLEYAAPDATALWAAWTFTGLTPGTSYRLALTWDWPDPVNRGVCPVTVLDSDGTTALSTGLTADQRDFPPSVAPAGTYYLGTPWAILGTFTPTGTSLVIKLGGINNYVIADAAWIQPASESVPEDGVGPHDPTAFASVSAGPWTNLTTWTPRGVPTDGDTATIHHAIALDADAAISGVALTLGASLTIRAGRTLTLHGDVTLTGATLTVGETTGGATLLFDPPAGRQYAAYSSSSALTCRGTSGRRSLVATKSGAAGSYGYFHDQLVVDAENTDFVRIGDGIHPALLAHTRYAGIRIVGCWFDYCGQVQEGADTGYDGVFERNRITNPFSATPLGIAFDAAGGALRRVVGNSVRGETALVCCQDATIEDNTFRGPFSPSTGTWASCRHNLRISSGMSALRGDTAGNYWVVAPPTSDGGDANPHFVGHGEGIAALSVDGDTFEYLGAEPSGNAGDWHGTATVRHCLTLPNAAGYNSGVLFDWSPYPGEHLIAEHNTMFVGGQWAIETTEGTHGPDMIGTILSYRSNLFIGKGGSGLKAYLNGTAIAGGVADIIDPANADYNASFDSDVSFPFTQNGQTCTYPHAKRGYIYNFSSDPGVHDQDGVDPEFLDPTRSLATFDSAYLGHSAPAWSGGGTYAVGDLVGHARSDRWYGATVNFRCIQSHAASAAGSEPGAGASWWTYWELASAWRIETLAPDLTYDPAVPQATPRDLIAWVRAGFAPTNAALATAGHDGTTIGAVAYAAPRAPIELGRAIYGVPSIPVLHLNGHTFFEKGAYWRQFARDISADPVDVDDDALMYQLKHWNNNYTEPMYVDFDVFGSDAAGGASGYSLGFNTYKGDGSESIELTVLPGNVGYHKSQFPRVVELAREPVSIENRTDPTYPDVALAGDHHYIGIRRDESTGGVARLTEIYGPVVTRDGGGAITDLAASSLQAWDLTVADPQPAPVDAGATDAAGMPIFPLVIRSEETGYGPPIGHCLRLTIPQGAGHPQYVYPARDGNGGLAPFWQGRQLGLPLGAKIRLKQASYDAHAGSFTGCGAALLYAMRHYGLILADWSYGGTMRLGGVADDGLIWAEFQGLRALTANDFECVEIPHMIRCSGPAAVQVGHPITITVSHEPDYDTNWALGFYSRAWGPTATFDEGAVTIDAAHPTHTVTITPAEVGDWAYVPVQGGTLWYADPFRFTVTEGAVATEATSYTLALSGGGSVGQPVTATVTPDGPYTGTITLTPSGCGLSTPATLTWANESGAKTATFTPASAGTLSVAGTSSPALTDPGPATRTIAAAGTMATCFVIRTATSALVLKQG